MTAVGIAAVMVGALIAGVPTILSRTRRYRGRPLTWLTWLCPVVGCALMIIVAGVEVGVIAAISVVLGVVALRQER